VIVPLVNESVIKGVILFPSGAEDYNSDTELSNEIRALIHEQLDITPDMEFIATWYVMATYLYDRMNTIAYLRAYGDFNTGKSRFIYAIGELCYNPIVAKGGTTPPAMLRLITQFKGTLVLDEADYKSTDETADISKILNTGNEKDGRIVKADNYDPNKVIVYKTYCPKVLAGRKMFDDPAIESRCITEIMEETEREDIDIELPAEYIDRQLHMRNKLLLYRFRNLNRVTGEESNKIKVKGVETRVRQAWGSIAPVILGNTEETEAFYKFMQDYQKAL